MIPVLEINPKISEVTKSEKGKISIKHQGKLSEYLLYVSHIYLVSAVVYLSYLLDKSALVLDKQKSLKMKMRNH